MDLRYKKLNTSSKFNLFPKKALLGNLAQGTLPKYHLVKNVVVLECGIANLYYGKGVLEIIASDFALPSRLRGTKDCKEIQGELMECPSTLRNLTRNR